MRKRKEIEDFAIRYARNGAENQRVAILEVLLDIRDLLKNSSIEPIEIRGQESSPPKPNAI